MSTTPAPGKPLFSDAQWYDRGINWDARLQRELPVLTDLFGPPGDGGVLDAGCGTGHEACALARLGYTVTGADLSEEMLAVARQMARKESADVRFILSPFAELSRRVGDGFDGIFCIGNALAAAGSRGAVQEAIGEFARCLRPGGRLLIQVLNFPRMRTEHPCVRGPRVAVVDGQEHVSVRQFHFVGDVAEVTNVTLWNDGGWKQRAHGGTLYPVTLNELTAWLTEQGMRVDHAWHSYAREPFDPNRSSDLLVAATRVALNP